MNIDEQREKIIHLVDSYNKPYLTYGIVDAIKPSIRMKTFPERDEDIPTGTSKIGGVPDLPVSWKWPTWNETPLEFIAQIALSEIAPYDVEHILPTSGILYFFFDIDLYFKMWNEQENFWKVLYYEGGVSQIQRVAILPVLPSTSPSEEVYTTSSCTVEFSNELTIPPFDSISLRHRGASILYPELWKNVEKLYNETSMPRIHRLLGHPNAIQNDMQVECQIDFEKAIPQYPVSEMIVKAAEVWTLLLQIDSDDNIKRDWGDSGRLYFWIRRDDLRARNFARVYAILQCY